MTDDVTPEGVRTRHFDVTRRGYDRSQVESFLAIVAARIDELESQVSELASGALAVGIDDREALARELHTIGVDVADILETARVAAEGMRTRAASDAETWTAQAHVTSEELLAEAEEQSQAARAAAWEQGSALLSAAIDEARSMIAGAKEEALFVRAEAEREALRLTGDAKRDREEAVRASRLEAESIVETARLDSESVLAAAHQQAELAQERARALEQRRTELLAELETARASISDMEEEIETKRQELESPPPPPEDDTERSHHGGDGGSVRIVSPSAFVPLRPVDAEEMVAEVTALRSAPTVPAATSPPVVEPTVEDEEPEATPPVTVVPDVAATTTDDDVVPRVADAAPIDATSTPDASPVAAPSSEEPVVAEPDVMEPTPSEADDGAVDAIGSLFAQLRSVPELAPIDTSPTQEMATPPADAEVDADTPEPSQGGDPTAVERADAGAETDTQPAEPGMSQIIPIQNAALRIIKRTLVELQNEALEHLRTDSAWLPNEEFTDRFRGPFAQLTEAVGEEADDSAGRVFGVDLFDSLNSAIERARTGGAGDREVAATASKVFRMWRSDEAERRVIDVATASVGQTR